MASEKNRERFPLHMQILAALVAGTIAGFVLNPGEALLPEYETEITYRILRRGPAVEVSVRDPSGLETFSRRFHSVTAFAQAFPELADLAPEEGSERVARRRVRIRQRILTIVEDFDRIRMQYQRTVGRVPVSSTIEVRSVDELAERHTAWLPLYRSHGGGWRRRAILAARFVGDLFLRLLRMVTIPLIVTSLVSGVASLGGTRQLGRLFWRTLAYYLTTSMLAIITGVLIVNLIRPGAAAELPIATASFDHQPARDIASIFRNLVDQMIPPNPVAALAGADFLAIITFSLLLGVFIIQVGEQRGRPLRELFQSGFDVMMHMTLFIIRLAPLGVFGFLVFAVGTQGLSVFESLGWYMLAVALGLCVHACLTLPLLVRIVAKRSPIEFARAMSPALLTAFSTASSNGTLPLTLSCSERRAGISNRVSAFVLPLGATINMDGTALYEAAAALFVAQAIPGAELTVYEQFVVAFTALMASVGAAGIPHAGLVMMAIVFQAVGLPLEAQGLIIAVDRVLDMLRTAVNVWSDSCGCAIVDRLERTDVAEAPTQPLPATTK